MTRLMRWLLPGWVVVCAWAEPAFQEHELFARGDSGYNTIRIPTLAISNAGTVLAFAEGRVNSPSDSGDIDIILRRSFDGGDTWSGSQLVYSNGGNTIGNPVPIVDHDTGTIWLLFCRNNLEVFVTSSSNDGASWTTPINITNDVADATWNFVATGPVHGFQTAGGRLVAPSYRNDTSSPSDVRSYMIYSDDHGATWTRGNFPSSRSGEASALETEDGRIYLNARGWVDNQHRATAFSSTGGLSWGPMTYELTLPDPPAQGSVIRFTDKYNDDRNRLLLSNPPLTVREKLSVRVSYDEGLSWTHGRMVSDLLTGYSDLAILPNGDIALLYERGASRYYDSIWFARFNREWLEQSADYVCWNFNEASSGSASSATGAIEDLSGSGLHATASGSPTYGPGAPAYGASSALIFTAGSDRVVWPDGGDRVLDFDATDSFTLEIVFMTTAHGSGGSSAAGGLIAKDWGTDLPSWWLRVQDGKPRFLIEDAAGVSASVTGSSLVNDGQWHHLAAVRDIVSKELRLYVDHELVGGTIDLTTDTLANDEDIVIGAFGNASREFIGSIDWARISRGSLRPESFVQPTAGGSTLAYWTFEEQAIGEAVVTLNGAIHDVSGNHRHATASDAALAEYIAGAPNYGQDSAVQFTAADADEVIFADTGENAFDFAGDASFTLEAVINTTQTDRGSIIAKDYGADLPSWWWRVEDNGRMKFLVSDGTNTSSVISDAADAVNDGQWRHVAAMRDRATHELRLYVDGALVKTATDTTTGSLGNDRDVVIGDFASASRPFVGAIDCVRVSAKTLATSEFIRPQPQPGLIRGDWSFDERPAGEAVPLALGKVLDTSGRHKHLSAQGVPTPVYTGGDPRLGTPAIELRAADTDQLAYIDRGDEAFDFDGAESFTLEAVINTSQVGLGGIIAKDDPLGGAGWSWQLEGSGIMRFSVSDGLIPISITSPAADSINDGVWHHIAAVRDTNAGQLQLYLDYVLIKSGPDFTTASLANDKNLVIGALHTSASSLSAALDHVRITAAALEPTDFLPCSAPGDLNCDGRIDEVDWSTLMMCLNGPGVLTPPAGCTPLEFVRSDLDDDGDVDVTDVGIFLMHRVGS